MCTVIDQADSFEVTSKSSELRCIRFCDTLRLLQTVRSAPALTARSLPGSSSSTGRTRNVPRSGANVPAVPVRPEARDEDLNTPVISIFSLFTVVYILWISSLFHTPSLHRLYLCLLFRSLSLSLYLSIS
eukprot:GILK01012530.1.p1 GENE.GILK01012530.1~~GILK01012530.1.p1  ORF type:complete len:130 (-),score=2.48 GILK01012530.1:203-592(-)